MASECRLISHLDARRLWCILVLAILETNAELGVPAIPSAEDEANTTYAHRTKAMAKHRVANISGPSGNQKRSTTNAHNW